MPAEVHLVPCLADNYAFLVRDRASGQVAAVDTPDASAILRELQRRGWQLNTILNTHWHGDHIGGNAQLAEETGATIIGPQEVADISSVDRIVRDGDEVPIGDTCFHVLGTEGHTLGHISYVSAADRIAFVGDTLFAMGCGRVLEGTHAQMWGSLMKLASLAEDVKVYCAHEYSAANARFALSVDTSQPVIERARAIDVMRARGEATVPTTIGAERSTNPFLRAAILRPEMSPTEAFALIRSAKDQFNG